MRYIALTNHCDYNNIIIAKPQTNCWRTLKIVLHRTITVKHVRPALHNFGRYSLIKINIWSSVNKGFARMFSAFHPGPCNTGTLTGLSVCVRRVPNTNPISQPHYRQDFSIIPASSHPRTMDWMQAPRLKASTSRLSCADSGIDKTFSWSIQTFALTKFPGDVSGPCLLPLIGKQGNNAFSQSCHLWWCQSLSWSTQAFSVLQRFPSDNIKQCMTRSTIPM